MIGLATWSMAVALAGAVISTIAALAWADAHRCGAGRWTAALAVIMAAMALASVALLGIVAWAQAPLDI